MGLEKIIELFALGITAVAAILIFWQIRQSKQQAITSFEDAVANEYRQIAKDIPVEALLGTEIEGSGLSKCLNPIYNYVDFTNQQIFLRQQKRIRTATWQDWCEGIESNFKLPAFKEAWEHIKKCLPESFSELRRLEQEGFRSDPIDWQLIIENQK